MGVSSNCREFSTNFQTIRNLLNLRFRIRLRRPRAVAPPPRRPQAVANAQVPCLVPHPVIILLISSGSSGGSGNSGISRNSGISEAGTSRHGPPEPPETSESPEFPEFPEASEAPEVPEAPEAPEIPETPQSPRLGPSGMAPSKRESPRNPKALSGASSCNYPIDSNNNNDSNNIIIILSLIHI